MKKTTIHFFLFFFLFVLRGNTQEVEILTLEDCLRIGVDNNLSLEGNVKKYKKVNMAYLKTVQSCCRKLMR